MCLVSWEGPLVELASGSSSNLHSFVRVTIWFLALGLLRLISERTIRHSIFRKGTHMTKNTTNGNISRNYLQYLFETLWAVGAGALAGPLAS